MEHLKRPSTKPFQFSLIIILALLVAIASEVKIIPFEGAPFRFGLGAAIFLLTILIQPLPIIFAGITTGSIVVLFRTILDVIFLKNTFLDSITTHFSSGLFYIVFALCLSLIKIEKYKAKPFLLASFVTLFEFLSNFIEELTTTFFVTNISISYKEMLLLFVVAFIRSFFVVGIYSFIIVTEQKKRVEHLLNIISNLYVETLYLQKSMNEIENITANSYDLYEKLKSKDTTLSMKALSIAQEIHEVKKDGQRILAGLSKIMKTEKVDSYFISDLLEIVKEGNKKYSDMLNKSIQIQTTYDENFYTREHISLLAIINNLVSNAVEAIEDVGTINISVFTFNNLTTIIVEDSGVGIPKNLIPVIFDPGFTTKFNSHGDSSTGIGLSHVKSIVTKLEGTIYVESNGMTKFTVVIPSAKLR